MRMLNGQVDQEQLERWEGNRKMLECCVFEVESKYIHNRGSIFPFKSRPSSITAPKSVIWQPCISEALL